MQDLELDREATKDPSEAPHESVQARGRGGRVFLPRGQTEQHRRELTETDADGAQDVSGVQRRGRHAALSWAMRRRVGSLYLSLGLALGCARATRAPAAPAVPGGPQPVHTGPPMAIREVPDPAFVDDARRSKISALLPAIREAVAQIVATDELVGLAVGIVVDGELVLGEGFGARHVDDGGAIDRRTVFRIGSITKVFTAITALRLAEQGLIDLDAPAADRLPELHTLVYPTRDARRLTVRDILSHTAGLPRNPDLPPLGPGHPPTRAELMQAIDGLSLVRAPGVGHEYSNLGFVLLGHIIAATSAQPYHDAIDEALLDPLAMQSTVWDLAAVPAERLARGHGLDGRRTVVTTPTQHGALDAAGGLFSTVEDLARFVGSQLAAWPPRSEQERAPLRRSTLREAHALRTFAGFRAGPESRDLAATGVEGGVAGVGLGWQVRHGCELPHVVTHNGATDGYHATVSVLPQAGVGIIVLANAGWADTDRIAEEIAGALERGGALEPRAPRALPGLTKFAARVIALLDRWDEQVFAELATRGHARARLAAQMRWLHEALGPCALGPLKRSTSAWSGVYPVQCERGRGELTLALTTARVAKIATIQLGWIDGAPAPAVQEAAVAAAPSAARDHLADDDLGARGHDRRALLNRHDDLELCVRGGGHQHPATAALGVLEKAGLGRRLPGHRDPHHVALIGRIDPRGRGQVDHLHAEAADAGLVDLHRDLRLRRVGRRLGVELVTRGAARPRHQQGPTHRREQTRRETALHPPQHSTNGTTSRAHGHVLSNRLRSAAARQPRVSLHPIERAPAPSCAA